jgi:hypothetical protein
LVHFTGLWDEAMARPLADCAVVGVALGVAVVVAVGEAVPVGVAVGPDVAVGGVEVVGRPAAPEVAPGVVPRELPCAVPELTVPAAWPVSDEEPEPGVVAWDVAGCVVSGSGTNGELMVGPPSIVLISRAT